MSAKERERQTECKAPLQKEAQVELGTGRGRARAGAGAGGGGVKGKSGHRTVLDSQSWWPGSHFYVPGCPPAHKQIASEHTFRAHALGSISQSETR